jgi:hypothetical protein
MKVIGVLRVLKAEFQNFTDKQTGEVKEMACCTGLTDDGEAVVFYRPASEEPTKDDIYQLVLSFNKCKPVIKYEKEK